jgi:HK97 family phage prohead protease
MERRAFQLEVRAAVHGRRLAGIAAPFGVDTRIGDVIERISFGAFATSLASGRDILALIDHDATRVLGRTKTGSLRLHEDARGLHFEIDLPATSAANDILALVERGDVGGMSFGFKAKDERWQGNRRELRAVDLREISVVSAFPAYSDTVVEARARGRAEAPDAGLKRYCRWR